VQRRAMAHMRRHRIPEQLEVLVDAYLELGEDRRRAVERLLPFLDRYGVRVLQAERRGGARAARDARDVHQQYTLEAEVATALAIVTGAARAVGDDTLVDTCCSLTAEHRAWRKAS
jgi:hypothetical protein